MQKDKTIGHNKLTNTGILALVLIVVTFMATGIATYSIYASDLNKKSALKNDAVQGCLEVAQSYKKTTAQNENEDKHEYEYELHEVSFNQDLYKFCVQQKGF